MGNPSVRRPATSATPSTSPWHLTPGAHVLILDDRNGSTDSLRAIVEREGFRVTQTMSAEQALTLATSAPIGAVIADIDMKGDSRDGLWLLHRLHTSATLAQVPVIGVTGQRAHQSVYVRAGFLTVLVEPVMPAELRGVLRSLTTMGRPA